MEGGVQAWSFPRGGGGGAGVVEERLELDDAAEGGGGCSDGALFALCEDPGAGGMVEDEDEAAALKAELEEVARAERGREEL